MNKLLEAWGIQFRVMRALVLRDTKSFQGGAGFAQFWMFMEPIFITSVVLSRHFLGNSGTGSGIVHGVPVVIFMLTGYCPHLLLRHGGVAGVGAVKPDLLYHRRIHFMDLILAKLFLESFLILVAFVLMYLLFYTAGILTLPRSIGLCYLGWVLHIWFAFTVGFIFTGFGLQYRIVTRFFQPFVYLMIPVYGAFSMLEWLPANVRKILLYFPPANATEVLRGGYFGNSVPTYYDIPYTIECNLVLTFIGLLILMKARTKLEA